ncbi:hypothetical protein HK097_005434, partial [Rhizophlyctis rosea]
MPSSRSRFIAIALLITLVFSVLYTFSSPSSSSLWLEDSDEPPSRLQSSSRNNDPYKPIPKVPAPLRLTEDDEKDDGEDETESKRVGGAKLGNVIMPKMANETQ